LTALFIKEGEVWNSVDTVYAQAAANLANYLVDHDGTDNTALLKVALDPFGLMPAVPSAEVKAALVSLAKQQITARQAALDDSYAKTTDAIQVAAGDVQENSRRRRRQAHGFPHASGHGRQRGKVGHAG
jgi:hypothetical protein